jgi:hypothetical protein
MSKLKFVLPAVVAMGGFLVCTTATYGKPEYTKQTKKSCTTCHVDSKAKPKDLTDTGKCFEKKKSLEGCSTEKK